MIMIENKADCCGCSACEQICPVHAISMRRDELGFDYPVVNENTCINCKACDEVCPPKNEFNVRIPQYVYAVKNKNNEERIRSSSGGVFPILAKDVLAKGGTVYGAAFDQKWNVHHIKIESEGELFLLQGSKYVQSKMGTTFMQVRKNLQEGRLVLFSGTPCQVAGLLRFLKKRYINLITVDVACHGVPNPRIWEDFLKKTSSNKTIEKIKFKNKSTGWNWDSYSFSMTISGKTSKTNVWKHPYMRLFLNDFILRPSCHTCHYRSGKSGADITIADYWGIERNHPDFFDNTGVSALLLWNTPLPQSIKKNASYIETRFDDFCYGNTAFKSSPPYKIHSTLFYLMYDKFHFPLNLSSTIGLIIKNVFSNLQKSIYFLSFIIKRFQSLIYGKNRHHNI